MNLRNVWIIFRKELLDVLRDRRTIFSMLLLPIFIYPLLIGGIGTIMSRQVDKMQERQSPIAVLGSQGAADLLKELQEKSGLQIITTLRDTANALTLLRDHTLMAVVLLPENLQERLSGGLDPALPISVWYDESSVESGMVVGRILETLNAYRQTWVQRQLEARQIPRQVIEPFIIDKVNRATATQMAGATLGMFIPYLMIIVTMTSCMYPAIDMTAGEKERGTIETLLVCPASRLEIVLGKFLTTTLIGMVTALLTVVSMSTSIFAGFFSFGSDSMSGLSFKLDPGAILLVFLLFIPVAALFASGLLAIAVHARSYKEAQSKITPLLILMVLPALTSMVPGLEVDTRLAFIPLINVSLTVRNAFMGIFDPALIAITFISSAIYAAFALFVTMRIFQKESVLLKI